MQRTATILKTADANGATAPQALKARWAQVSARLRAELGDDLFNSWFARMEAQELTADSLTVSVPTRFLKSWIENHYATKLRKIAEAEFGALQTINLRVRLQGEQALATAQT
ncbi:MAG: DnaA N-terminal domain-containing protein, partial [Aestuariivirga sp.]